MEMARSIPNGKGLHNSFWAEAVNTAGYILNRSGTKAVDGKTPQEAYRYLEVSALCTSQTRSEPS
jgi:hypothetical protein